MVDTNRIPGQVDMDGFEPQQEEMLAMLAMMMSEMQKEEEAPPSPPPSLHSPPPFASTARLMDNRTPLRSLFSSEDLMQSEDPCSDL